MTIYRLYIFLLDIAPPIWRRIELSSETSRNCISFCRP